MTARIFGILVALVLPFVPAGVAAGGDYVIGEEDMLQISVWGNPELNAQLPVRPDGMISVALVGDIRAAGLTPPQLKALLEQEFSKYVKAPTVSVLVTAINSFKVYVVGEGVGRVSSGGTGASQSGAITLRRNTTLLQLISQLGSLKEADLSGAYLMRNKQKLNVDFQKLVLKGDVSQDIPLQRDDILFIPDNFGKRIRVVGAVKTPGIFPYQEGMTALDAVLTAGGFTEFASQNSVVIVRKEGDAVKNIDVKLKDVIGGEISKNVPLKPGDLVTVKTSIF